MPQSIQEAADLNNESVSLLCCGDYHGAVTALTSSLAIMRRYVTRSGLQQEEHHPDQPLPAWRHHLRREFAKSASTDRPTVLPAGRALNGLHSPNFFIFNRCMEITATTTLGEDGTSIRMETLPLYSACIVLNLALVHHQLGVQSVSHEGRFNLLKAEKMYHMVLQLLQSPCLSNASFWSGRQAVVSMRLISLNNLAALHEAVCSISSTRSGNSEDTCAALVKQLHAALMQARIDGDGSFLSDLDLQCFALNVELWGSRRIITAVAA